MSGKQLFDVPTSKVFLFDPDELVIIGLDTPHKRGEHALYDERIELPLDPADVQNVIYYGVKLPVVAVKQGDKPVIVDGRQRVRWAREANRHLRARAKERGEEIALLKIKVMFQSGSDGDLLGVLVSLNEIREADTPLVRAEKALRLIQDYNKSEAEVAMTFGVGVPALKNWMYLATAVDEVKAAVAREDITPAHGMKIGRAAPEEQRKILAQLLEAKAKGTAPTLQIVTAVTKATRAPAPKDPTEEAIEGTEAPPMDQIQAALAPAKRLLRSLVKNWEEDTENTTPLAKLTKEQVDMVRWFLGDLNEARIPGMKAALNYVRKLKTKNGVEEAN